MLIKAHSLMSLLFLFTLCSVSCGKKTVTDPGPQFSMETADFHINGAATSGIVLKRGDAAYGPTIHIDTQKPEAVTAVEKWLNCGSFKIPGVKRLGADPQLLWFKFNDDEFRGLSTLPSYTACTLTVTVINEVGSTVSKSQSLFFSFDRGPALEIARQTAANGLNTPTESKDIPIEHYSVRNNFAYPIRIRYSPVKIFDYTPCYLYKAQNAGPEVKLPLSCNKDLIRAAANILKIEGDYSALEQDLPRTMAFTLNPHGWANLEANLKLPDELSMAISAMKIFVDPSTLYLRIFSGVFITGFLNYTQEPLTLEPSLPLTPVRSPETIPEVLTPLQQSGFAGFKDVRRPDYIQTR